MNIFELFGTIAIKNKDANAAIGDTTQKAERAGQRIQAAFKNIGAASIKVGKVVGAAAAAIGTAFVAGVESTRDYRAEMAKLNAAFLSNGHSAETAKETYKALQKVLGETDQAVEAANHLAVMVDNEEDLVKWTDALTGVYATFGASLPIEGLTESANETAKVGQVTGSLADALNWAGISEEDFNKKLSACTTDAERQDLIMNTLFWTYRDASEQYKKTGESVMKANEAQDNLNAALAKLGAIGSPILTGIKNKVADMVTASVPYIETFISNISNIEETWNKKIWPMIQNGAKVQFGIDLPEWKVIETNVNTWWTETAKPQLDELFKATVGLLLPDSDAEGTPWITKLGAWFDSIVKSGENMFKATVGLLLPDADGEGTPWITKLGAWFDGIVKSRENMFKATVSLLLPDADGEGTPWTTKLGAWFDGIVKSRENMFKVTVGLLTHDTDETGQRWSVAIADWFHAMVREVAEQLKLTFNIVMPTAEETAQIQNNITTWLNGEDGKSGIVGLIANAIALPFDLAFQECMNIWEDFGKWLESTSKAGKISTETHEESAWAKGEKYDYRLWGYTQEELALMQKWIDATREREKLDFSSTEKEVLAVEAAVTSALEAMEAFMGKDRADQLHSDYQSWLSGQLDAEKGIVLDIPLSLMEGAGEKLQTEIDGLGLEAPVKLMPDYSGLNGVSTLGRSALGRVIPTSIIAASHASGLERVPHDGYLARLHKEEAVLNSRDAAIWRGGGSGKIEALLTQLIGIMSAGQVIRLDSGVMAGQLAPAIDARLGATAKYKGRGN